MKIRARHQNECVEGAEAESNLIAQLQCAFLDRTLIDIRTVRGRVLDTNDSIRLNKDPGVLSRDFGVVQDDLVLRGMTPDGHTGPGDLVLFAGVGASNGGETEFGFGGLAAAGARNRIGEADDVVIDGEFSSTPVTHRRAGRIARATDSTRRQKASLA